MSDESETEKWRRLTNPQTTADWGASINLQKLAQESPRVFFFEIAPFLSICRCVSGVGYCGDAHIHTKAGVVRVSGEERS